MLATLLNGFQDVFVPLIVAMSPLTVLPLFLSMTRDLPQETERALARSGVITAFFVAVGVTLAGQGLFRWLGITVNDLRVAGGLILFIISVHDLLFSRETRANREDVSELGVVPLGIPLIVGPATLTACLVLADVHGRGQVILGLLLNLMITSVLLFNARRLVRVMKPAIIRAFGKVMSLFLAAIAVAMVRTGVTLIVAG